MYLCLSVTISVCLHPVSLSHPDCLNVRLSVTPWLSQCVYLLVYLSHLDCLCGVLVSVCHHLSVLTSCLSVYHTLTVSVLVCLSHLDCLSVCTCWSVFHTLSISVNVPTCFSFWQSEEAAVNLFFHLRHSPASSAVFFCATLTSD